MVTEKFTIIIRACLWSAIAFTLNLAWEIAHARLYTLWVEADRLTIAWSLVHCTLGDIAIALTLFALAGIALRQADWPVSSPWAGGAIVTVGAVAFTVWSEWYNVYQIGSWGYTTRMPLILGIGLSPLLQWLILPPLMTIAYRSLCPKLFSRANPLPSQ